MRAPGAEVLPGRPVSLDATGFDAVVSGTELPVIVDFYADWCGPCKAMAPAFAQAAAQLQGRALFVKVDTESASDLAARFGIRSIPTVVRLQRGRETARFAGARPAGDILRFAQG